MFVGKLVDYSKTPWLAADVVTLQYYLLLPHTVIVAHPSTVHEAYHSLCGGWTFGEVEAEDSSVCHMMSLLQFFAQTWTITLWPLHTGLNS